MNFRNSELLSKVTVIVPLKDNPRRTMHFLKHSLDPSIRYIIADGSFRDENQHLLANNSEPNCEYIRFGPDRTLADFLSKMAQAVSLVSTEFVMTLDAGDYLLPSGVQRQAALLADNTNASCVCGDIYFTRQIGEYVTPLRIASSAKQIDGLEVEEALTAIRDGYTHNWYSLFRKNVLLDTWRLASRYEVQHPFLEYLPTLVALSYGPVLRMENPAIVRVAHGPSAWTEQPIDTNVSSTTVRDELRSFAAMIQQEVDIDAEQVVDSFSTNAEMVSRQALRSTRSQWIADGLERLGLSRSLAQYFGLNALSHFAGYWLNRRGEGLQVGKLGFTADGLRLRRRSRVLGEVK
jgi:glycosyltransferase domain-containing protein